jgi:hypothetical protein
MCRREVIAYHLPMDGCVVITTLRIAKLSNPAVFAGCFEAKLAEFEKVAAVG